MHAMGIGDIALFEAKLLEEQEALEAANAESVLSSAPLVDSVIFQLHRVHGVLGEKKVGGRLGD